MLHLYPDLVNDSIGGDYALRNDSDGRGGYVVWFNNEIPEPTDQEIADAKEDAMNAYWWKLLRKRRDGLLKDTDAYGTTDRPDNSEWLTYRQELRDLPITVSKPDYETLNNQSVGEWDINSLMPTKPSEE